jgi:hypothetical protein
MFHAIGIGARRDALKNLITVKVRLEDDRVKPPKVLGEREYTAATFEEIVTLVTAQLVAMKNAEEDTTLNDQIVGKPLARV